MRYLQFFKFKIGHGMQRLWNQTIIQTYSKNQELNTGNQIECLYFWNKSTTFLIQGILYKFTHSDYNHDDDNDQECFVFDSVIYWEI